MANQHGTGVLLVVISAFVFSSAGVFTKGVPTPAWDIIFWRGVSAVTFTLGYLVLRGKLMAEVRAFCGPALSAALVFGAGSAAFIPAFKLSTVSNVALIYGAVSFVAPALAWLFLRERPSVRAACASTIAFAGVIMIVSGGIARGHLAGDLLALFMTVMMAAGLVIYRRFPQTTAALPAAVSALLLLPLALWFGDPFAVPVTELPVLVAFGLVFAVASVTLSEGARRLPSAETALLTTLELPLAPVLALVVLNEMPPLPTVMGGGIIVLAVLWSQRRVQAATKLP